MAEGVAKLDLSFLEDNDSEECNECHGNIDSLQYNSCFINDYISQRKLQDLSGCQDLSQVSNLTFAVDTSSTSLGKFGLYLPNLKELRLTESKVYSLRDLGSSLNSLCTLWMPHCGLQDLDGISSMVNLTDLYLSYNSISDISSLGMLECVEVIDLEGNNVEDLNQVLFLSTCSKLTRLTLDGNPICHHSHPSSKQKDYNYRQAVVQSLPSLKYLDDEPARGSSHKAIKANSLLTDWAYLDELKQDTLLESVLQTLDKLHTAPSYNDVSAPSHRTPVCRSHLLSEEKLFTLRPCTSRPQSSGSLSARPVSHESVKSIFPLSLSARITESNMENEDLIDSSSSLTTGMVVCGNPSKALRNRKKLSPSPDSSLVFTTVTEKKVDTNYFEVEDEPRLESDLVQELNEWRKHHEIVLRKIKEEKTPQILKVNSEELASDPDSDFTEEDLIKMINMRKGNDSHTCRKSKSDNFSLDGYTRKYRSKLTEKTPINALGSSSEQFAALSMSETTFDQFQKPAFSRKSKNFLHSSPNCSLNYKSRNLRNPTIQPPSKTLKSLKTKNQPNRMSLPNLLDQYPLLPNVTLPRKIP